MSEENSDGGYEGSSLAGGNGGQSNGAGQGHNSGGAFDANGDWRSYFSTGLADEEAKAWKDLSSRYKEPQQFAKSVLELRKSHDSRIPVPGPNAKEDDWNKVYDRLGRPKEPAAYEFRHLQDAPELDDSEKEARENFRGVAHRLGLTQRQVDGLTQWNDSFRKTSIEAYSVQAKQTVQKATTELKREWGPDFDKNLNVYRTTLQEYAGNDFKSIASMRLADGSFLGDHPTFVRMWAKVGMERGEDDRDPTMLMDAGQRESLQAQIDKIEGEALRKNLHPAHPNWPNKELQPLYEKLHGKKPMGPGGVNVRR